MFSSSIGRMMGLSNYPINNFHLSSKIRSSLPLEMRTRSLSSILSTVDISSNERAANIQESRQYTPVSRHIPVSRRIFSSHGSPEASQVASSFPLMRQTLGVVVIPEHHIIIKDNIQSLQEYTPLSTLLEAFEVFSKENYEIRDQQRLCGKSFILAVLSSSHQDRSLLVTRLFELGFRADGRACEGEYIFDIVLNERTCIEEALPIIAALYANGYSLSTRNVHGRPVLASMRELDSNFSEDMDEFRKLLKECHEETLKRLAAYPLS